MSEDDFTCPNCGADVPAKAKACPECGADEKTGWAEDTIHEEDPADFDLTLRAEDSPATLPFRHRIARRATRHHDRLPNRAAVPKPQPGGGEIPR